MSTEKLIAGIDEVGRGCLAGPVVVACVIMPYEYDEQYQSDIKKIKDLRCYKCKFSQT